MENHRIPSHPRRGLQVPGHRRRKPGKHHVAVQGGCAVLNLHLAHVLGHVPGDPPLAGLHIRPSVGAIRGSQLPDFKPRVVFQKLNKSLSHGAGSSKDSDSEFLFHEFTLVTKSQRRTRWSEDRGAFHALWDRGFSDHAILRLGRPPSILTRLSSIFRLSGPIKHRYTWRRLSERPGYLSCPERFRGRLETRRFRRGRPESGGGTH